MALNRERYDRLKALSDRGEVGKLNVHSVFRQRDLVLRCPRCGESVSLTLEMLERSSAVFLTPKEHDSA
jgi:hypothetical protein